MRLSGLGPMRDRNSGATSYQASECRGWRGVGVIKEQQALGACLEWTTRRVLKVTSPTPPGSNERGAPQLTMMRTSCFVSHARARSHA